MTTTGTAPRNGVGSALAHTTPSAVAEAGAYAVVPQTFGELESFCKLIAMSDLAPKDFKGKPGNVLVAVQMGAEIGLKPMQAIQNIAVINGRPSVWGDAALGLIKQHPLFVSCEETIAGDADKRTATCTMIRKGEPPVTRTFSVFDAKKARLFDKDGPWKQYPDRMLQMRARGFAGRDAFPDALKGLAFAEEAMDIPNGDAQPAAAAAPGSTRTDSVLAKVVSATTADPAPAATAPAEEAAAQEAEIRDVEEAKDAPAADPDPEHVAPPSTLDSIRTQAKRRGLSDEQVDEIFDNFGGPGAIVRTQLAAIQKVITDTAEGGA